MSTHEDWRRFAVGLARALGAANAAVAVTLLAPGRVPVVVGLAAGGAALFLTGRVRQLPPGETGALAYAGPVLAVLTLRVFLAAPADFDAVPREVLAFLWAAWRATPAQAYLAAVAFGAYVSKPVVFGSPFDQPKRR